MNTTSTTWDRPDRASTPKTHALSNYLKTALLLAAMTALALVIGERLGGPSGLAFAGIFVAVMNFGTWWFSDKIALALHGAKPIDRAQLTWLHEMVEGLAQKAGLPMPRIYLVDIPTPNAFATGRSPSRAAVAVTTGILQLMDRRELQAVLAHELAHVQNRDTLISTVAATIAGVITWAVQSLFWFGGSFLRNDDDEGGGSAFASLGLLLVAPIAATLLQLAISRSREYGADARGAAIVEDPEALASALGKLQRGVEHLPYDRAPATAHMWIVNPLHGGGVMKLFSTHPPVEERIRRLMSMRVQRGW
jgi:heat shock protein HtpX